MTNVETLLRALARNHRALEALPVVPYAERTTENTRSRTLLVEEQRRLREEILAVALALPEE